MTDQNLEFITDEDDRNVYTMLDRNEWKTINQLLTIFENRLLMSEAGVRAREKMSMEEEIEHASNIHYRLSTSIKNLVMNGYAEVEKPKHKLRDCHITNQRYRIRNYEGGDSRVAR